MLYIIIALHFEQILFFRNDLDELAEGNEHYQERFTVSLSVFVSDQEKLPTQPAPWLTDKNQRTADVLFGSQIEKDETVDNFGIK